MPRTFASLSIRNYRLFYVGQGISLCGTWMQRVAQAWLVLEMTDSGTAVGVVAALQFLPTLIVSPFGGLLADRMDKRKILYLTQAVGSVAAVALGVLTLTGAVELWMVYGLALLLGLATSIDSPVRQTFVIEMVGRDHLVNAVSLHSTLLNAARIIGPALAGVLIVTVGLGWCFVLNAVSYVALVAALALMDPSELHPEEPQARAKGQLLEGFRYATSTPEVALPLILMTVAGIFAYEYQVVLPLFARFTFDGNAQTFSLMTASMGTGAIVGGLMTASFRPRRAGALPRIALLYGLAQLVVSAMPTLATAIISLMALGAASVAFIALGNTTLQLISKPSMRGRVVGLFLVAFLGSTPIGGPLMGWIAEQTSPRVALAIGGLMVVMTTLFLMRRMRAAGDLTSADPGSVLGPPPAKA